MRIAVLGGGVVGVATAYYLQERGHEVTVIDRQPAVARETSFANAGMIAPGHAFAWASPRAPKLLLQSLWRDDTALKFRLKLDPRLWSWSLKFLAQCKAEKSRANTLVKLRLCLLSIEEMRRIRQAEGFGYDEVLRGALYLYRDQKLLETGLRNAQLLQDNGVTGLRAIDREELVRREPALAAAKDKLAGALFSEQDESGDCALFSQRLAERVQARGGQFLLGRSIAGLRSEKGKVTAVATDRGEVTADAYVLSLGSYSPQVARSVGLKVPIYPVKGYSLTIPVGPGHVAPQLPGVDEHYLVAFARMGDKLRLTATADFAGYDLTHSPKHFAPMLRVARDLFPNGGAYDKPSYWACLRPMTPDGPPVIGRSKLENLWFNTGHGHIGWTMACASARVCADLMAGLPSPVPLDGLEPGRYAA
jgi:D-amino-acid dehydrogenase